MTRKDIVERGRRVLRMATEALSEAENRIGDDFARAVECIARSEGRVIVSGAGKSGLIGRKIAATLTSTAHQRRFASVRQRPRRPRHRRRIGRRDSDLKGGESDELPALLDHLKRLRVSR
jgi:arabinose-5-phosphate isomerase